MNDLAEKALHGWRVTRAQVARRPALALSISGGLVSALVVVAGGRIGAAPASFPLDSWLGLLPRNNQQDGPLPGVLMIAGIAALLALWLIALRVLPRTESSRVWAVAAAWGTPFAVGPPLLGTGIYSSVAHGLLARAGHDPYVRPPSRLGTAAIVDAIDPTWRSAPSTGGPLSTLAEHLAVSISGGSPIGAVIVLRALAVATVIAIGLLAAELAGPRRSAALAVTVLNPAVLLYLVSGAHFEALLTALLLGALLTAGQRRWSTAILLAAAATALEPVALVVLPAVIATHALGRRRREAIRTVARDTALAVAGLAVATVIVRDGLGWARNIGTNTRAHTPFAPASLASDLLSPIVSSASFDDLAEGGRIAAWCAAATVIAVVLVSLRSRPLDRTAGYGLLAVGLFGPVLYPWYLLPGLLSLAPTAVGVRLDFVVAASAVACVLAPAGFGGTIPRTVGGASIGLIACVLAARLLRRRRAALVSVLDAAG